MKAPNSNYLPTSHTAVNKRFSDHFFTTNKLRINNRVLSKRIDEGECYFIATVAFASSTTI